MKVVLTLAFCVFVGMAFGSFSITNVNFDKIKDKTKGKTSIVENDKYSLKNLRRPASFFSLSSIGTTYPPASEFNKVSFLDGFSTNPMQQENDDNSEYVNVNSTIRLRNGNSVVIYPYNFKVKADPFRLFKTPSAPTR